MAKQKVSISRIAAELNLSSTTVSLVLNQRGDSSRISKNTQALVQEKAKEMGWQPKKQNAGGFSICRNKPLIAVFWPTEQLNRNIFDRYYSCITAYQMQHQDEFECLFLPYVREKLYLKESFITRDCFDGIMMGGLMETDRVFLESKERDIPIALVNRDSTHFASIMGDSYEIGKKVAKHFLKRGHESFCVISPPKISQACSINRTGFMDELSSEQISQERIFSPVCEPDEPDAFAEIDQILCQTHHPTAFYCVDDYSVRGLYDSIRRHGISIPGEVEIISAGNHLWNSYLIPTVTSVQPPAEKIIACCFEYLTSAIREQDHKNSNVYFYHPGQIIFRESCPEEGRFTPRK